MQEAENSLGVPMALTQDVQVQSLGETQWRMEPSKQFSCFTLFISPPHKFLSPLNTVLSNSYCYLRGTPLLQLQTLQWY